MRRLLIGLCVISGLVGCSTPEKNAENDELSTCFLLYDINDAKFLTEEGGESCKNRISPGSTFKIPLYLIASNEKVISGPNEKFTWDGKTRMIPNWNKDQTAASWIQNSTVWVSQEITPKVSVKTIEAYLSSFGFGNADASGEQISFWLTKAPFAPGARPSLEISAYEQLEFLNKLWKYELAISKKSMKEIISIIRSKSDDTKDLQFYGKTGSGFINYETFQRLGWYVGYVKKGDKAYSFVMKVEDKVAQKEAKFAGQLAKGMAIKMVSEVLK